MDKELIDKLNNSISVLTGSTDNIKKCIKEDISESDLIHLQYLYEDIEALIKWKSKLKLSNVSVELDYLSDLTYDDEHKKIGIIYIAKYEYINGNIDRFIFKLPESLHYDIAVSEELMSKLTSLAGIFKNQFDIDLSGIRFDVYSDRILLNTLDSLRIFDESMTFLDKTRKCSFKYDYKAILDFVISRILKCGSEVSFIRSLFKVTANLCMTRTCLREVYRSNIKEYLDTLEPKDNKSESLPTNILYISCESYVSSRVESLIRKIASESEMLNFELSQLKDDEYTKFQPMVESMEQTYYKILTILRDNEIVTKIDRAKLPEFFERYYSSERNVARIVIDVKLDTMFKLNKIRDNLKYETLNAAMMSRLDC